MTENFQTQGYQVIEVVTVRAALTVLDLAVSISGAILREPDPALFDLLREAAPKQSDRIFRP